VVGGLVVIVAIVVLALVASRRRRDANNLMASDLNEFQNPTFDQRPPVLSFNNPYYASDVNTADGDYEESGYMDVEA